MRELYLSLHSLYLLDRLSAMKAAMFKARDSTL